MKETLEEALERLYPENIIKLGNNTSYDAALIKRKDFTDGVNWQAERMYSEEEVFELLLKHQSDYRNSVRNTSPLDWSFDIKDWFEQFKKK
jgi:hypothetical protein